MALIAEDGSGRADAESYITVANADARHSALGNVAWADADQTAKEAALRRATNYLEQTYRSRWSGERMKAAQALSWPRWGVCLDGFPVDSTSVPREVAGACADLALRALSADLAPDLSRSIVREKVGPIETQYDPYAPRSTQFIAVEMSLAPFFKGSAGMAQLVRA